MANNLVKGSGCGTREWRENFVLTSTDQSTALFSVAQATGNTTVAGTLAVAGAASVGGNLSVTGTVTSAGAIDNNGNLTITNAAPFVLLADSTGSAKQLKVLCDGNKAQLRETGDADGTLLVLDLANKRVGVATASPSVALDVTGAAAVSGNATVGGTLGITGAATFTAAPIFTSTSSPTASGTGTTGQVVWDASYLYVCTATNTWKRVALTGGY